MGYINIFAYEIGEYHMLSVHEVALQLKVSDQHIRSLLRKGDLKAEMIGKQWIIHQEAVNKYIYDYNIIIEPDDHPCRAIEIPDIIALSFFSGAMGLDPAFDSKKGKRACKPLVIAGFTGFLKYQENLA